MTWLLINPLSTLKTPPNPIYLLPPQPATFFRAFLIEPVNESSPFLLEATILITSDDLPSLKNRFAMIASMLLSYGLLVFFPSLSGSAVLEVLFDV